MTDPTPTSDNAHEVESLTEQQMRSDFMHVEAIYAKPIEDYDPADDVDYNDYASPWLMRTDEWSDAWIYLHEATERYRFDRTMAEKWMRHRAAELTPVQLRSEEQARYIAGHDFARDESGLLTSHYGTRLFDRSPEGSAPSPLANYRPGHAVTNALNTERNGIER